MALPTNTYTRYSAGTNVREDLIDKITNTSPEETPVISSFGRDTAENTYHEWQRDTLRAANKDNAALDGDDATGSAKTAPGRVANYCQIFQDTIVVSGRAEVVKKAGMKSAMAYYKGKAYKELQRDMEAALLSANPAVAGATGTAPKAGGLGVLIYTNASHGAGGSTTAHTSGAPTTAPVAGTARAFTETLLKTSAQIDVQRHRQGARDDRDVRIAQADVLGLHRHRGQPLPDRQEEGPRRHRRRCGRVHERLRRDGDRAALHHVRRHDRLRPEPGLRRCGVPARLQRPAPGQDRRQRARSR
jgi:hypothetical protein